MKVTYYGHSCFLLEVSGQKILFDPFISGNELAKSIEIDKIKADFILISHGNADHTGDALRMAKNTGAKVISNFEIITWLEKQGITNVHPMNTGGHWFFDFGK